MAVKRIVHAEQSQRGIPKLSGMSLGGGARILCGKYGTGLGAPYN
nr:hypothetical protein [uncultured Blautia sp.]